ncbi:hypothetical protein RCCS2_03092 [Roseobacter sp. CCS2]|nr:hypothetical protein RCCS2_03092 [Roseobacter sp. CCS2]
MVSNLAAEVLIYMSCAFLLGLGLGWVAWRIGREQERKSLVSQVNFWETQLEEARRQRDADIGMIDVLRKEKVNLKKRVASLMSRPSVDEP